MTQDDTVGLEQAVKDGVLPPDWTQKLSEIPPERVQESIRRGLGVPPPVAPGPTGPVERVTAGEMAGRVGEGGWQYLYTLDADGYEGVWADIGRMVPNRFSPDRTFIYKPDGLYLDTRMTDAELFVRRRLQS